MREEKLKRETLMTANLQKKKAACLTIKYRRLQKKENYYH